MSKLLGLGFSVWGSVSGAQGFMHEAVTQAQQYISLLLTLGVLGNPKNVELSILSGVIRD